MKQLLEQSIMKTLEVIQTNLDNISHEYYSNGDSTDDDNFSCVRCSGSAGRYVYEKQENSQFNGEQ